MTAVEWLVQKTELTDFWKEEIQQAIEMEKEQIMQAYKFNATGEPEGAEHYYEMFYKKY
jgi:hypothetical protein